jgi:uncharacterized membrane protein YphA (DoxX/SURF4 family)
MPVFNKLEKWSEDHHAGWMDALRIVLGLILTAKGFQFIMDTSSLVKILNENFSLPQSIVWAQVLAIIHLLTGFLITIGLATRISCLIEIPVLIGAIIFVNINGEGEGGFELVLSIVVLLLLVFFFFKGSGKFSAYYYMVNSRRSRNTDESKGDYQGGSTAAPMDKEANIR